MIEKLRFRSEEAEKSDGKNMSLFVHTVRVVLATNTTCNYELFSCIHV